MLVAEVSRFGGPEVLTARRAADPAAGPGQVVIGTALRELGLGLEVVRAILSRAATLAQVAAAHVAELDEQIRILRLRRAVSTSGPPNRLTSATSMLATPLVSPFPPRYERAPAAGIGRGTGQIPAHRPRTG